MTFHGRYLRVMKRRECSVGIAMNSQERAGEGSVYPAAAERRAQEIGVVHALRFSTPDALDHCARALDVVRRMGFDLVSVWARQTPGASFVVHVNFVPLGELPPRVLADRVSRFVGVTGVDMTAV